MRLAPGARLGAYEVVALVGAGGMGEVYRAHDTTLKRDVALKVLPEAFAADPDRLARFRREAQTLAALNHQHIAAIYGFESGNGASAAHALVLEFVEGPTLADRLAGASIPITEALTLAKQIAEALEAAHDRGIVHRDLKPANIKVTPEGVLKVLDFGLAKAASSEGAGPDVSHSPTFTGAGTRAGVILGTAAYMSPEQARGQVVDKRTDIWAFGCVLYEMLAGRAPFARDTVADTLAALVDRDPDWQALPAVPDRIRDLLRHCLQKDSRRRLRDIGDARLDIEDAIAGLHAVGNIAVKVNRRPIVPWVLAAAISGSLITALTLLLFRQEPEISRADFALTISPPSASGIQPVETGLARPEISPDGSVVAYHDRSGTLQLRRLDRYTTEPLRTPTGLAKVWSPDSKFLLFAEKTALKRIRVPDGAPETLGQLPDEFSDASVSEDGTLLFLCCRARFGLYLFRPGATGSEEIVVPGLKGGTYTNPWFLPGGEDFLIGFLPGGSSENQLYLVTLRGGKPIDPVLLMKNVSGPRYTEAGGGRVVFVRNDDLYSQRLSRTARKLEGEPELVERGIASRGAAHFSVSRGGIVAWRPGRAVLAQVTAFDRKGKPIGTAGPAMSVGGSLRLSPDERRLLLAARDGQAWLLEPNQSGQFTVSQGHLSMQWSPDSVSFLVPQDSRIIEYSIGGSSDPREWARVPGLVRLEAVSADRKMVLFRDASFASALFLARLDGPATPTTIRTGQPVSNVRFSPDERWIVYQTLDAEKGGIHVQAFPGDALPKQIASSGESPVWRNDGKEILYLDGDRIWSVRVDASGTEFQASDPELLFAVRSLEGGRRLNGIAQLAVSRDGSRIFYQQPVEQPDSDVIHVRVGWDGPARR